MNKPRQEKTSPRPLADTELSPSRSRRQQPVLIVVEPCPEHFLVLKRALWKAGATARVWWAQSAADALETLAHLIETVPEICVVSEVRLPDGDGLELLEKVRAGPGGARLRSAILTENVGPELVGQAADRGVHTLLTKPEGFEDWIQTARTLQNWSKEQA